MTVRVEFYGIPRQRAGVETAEIEAASLGEAISQLAARFPEVARECFDGERMASGYLANVNAQRFTTDPSTPLVPGDTLLILSADVGG